MSQLTNYKHKIVTSDNASLIKPSRITKYKKCSSCKKIRKPSNENHLICHHYYNYDSKECLSGNKVIDDFIKHTQTNKPYESTREMKFVPYDRFENIEFIAEGGFSKIYKATWIGKPRYHPYDHHDVVLKKLNNSKNITSKELNELRVYYDFYINKGYIVYISEYYGITQDPITQDMMIIMQYYDSGDLIHYITKDFYNISWVIKLENLSRIILGLMKLHSVNIVHRDFHSGNIFFGSMNDVYIGDFGLSKSATTESTDNDNENYGIIPYMAPEIFQGQKYTKKSDVYSFGMIMWEFMTGRRPFWDRNHDADLIIDIIDGLRPPIVTDAPEGYIELMKKCWHPDPEKRSTVETTCNKMLNILDSNGKNPIKIIESPNIGPVINKPGAIYKSRALSAMIQSAMSSKRLKTQSTGSVYYLESDANSTGNNVYNTRENDFDFI